MVHYLNNKRYITQRKKINIVQHSSLRDRKRGTMIVTSSLASIQDKKQASVNVEGQNQMLQRNLRTAASHQLKSVKRMSQAKRTESWAN